MNEFKTSSVSNGFALFTVVWIAAILSVLSLTGLSEYRWNTIDTGADLQRIESDMLLNSGLRFAALNIASPRSEVLANGMASSQIIYRNPVANLNISIDNEAGMIDLRSADSHLLDELLKALKLSEADQREAKNRLSENSQTLSHRNLAAVFAGISRAYPEILKYATLHSGSTGVNPTIASKEVLAMIPDLSAADRKRLIKQREAKSLSLFTSPLQSNYFDQRLAAYYRIKIDAQIRNQNVSRSYIIRMRNQSDKIFELVATL